MPNETDGQIKRREKELVAAELAVASKIKQVTAAVAVYARVLSDRRGRIEIGVMNQIVGAMIDCVGDTIYEYHRELGDREFVVADAVQHLTQALALQVQGRLDGSVVEAGAFVSTVSRVPTTITTDQLAQAMDDSIPSKESA